MSGMKREGGAGRKTRKDDNGPEGREGKRGFAGKEKEREEGKKDTDMYEVKRAKG
ncbi:hypothetical protein [Lacticaseibacillus casei]|uniref:hypothetical protein n=1 Tax=Lacticaseibacillus casei TaxID=1582 RepID=UPI003AFF95E3